MRQVLWLPLVCLVAVVVAGCGAPALMVKKDLAPSEIGLYVRYGDSLDQRTTDAFRKATNQFVGEFNSERHKFMLAVRPNDSVGTIKVDVSQTGLAGPGKQAAGCIVSTMGLAAPFVMLAAKMPIIVWFAYIPQNNTVAKLSLSSDIAATSTPIVRNFRTFPYFGSLESQRVKHAAALKVFLRQVVLEVERSILAQK